MSHDQPPTERTGDDPAGLTLHAPTTTATPSGDIARTPGVLRQPRWSGKKTAVVAALAIGMSSAGAIGAAAASPATDSGGGGFGHVRGGNDGPGRRIDHPHLKAGSAGAEAPPVLTGPHSQHPATR